MKAPRLKKENGLGLGIDIERIQNLPASTDFSHHPFYTENFSAEEINYCVKQHKPIESFAGLFCAKEALIKADNAWLGRKFNEINILHDIKGKPILHGYQISISHAGEYAIGIVQSDNSNDSYSDLNKKISQTKVLAILSTLLALISIVIHFTL